MALVGISALMFFAARKWLPSWQRSAPPKIGDFALYESAPPSDDLRIRVGPNVFEVASVVRNDRDGSLRFEDGRGSPSPARQTPETTGLVKAASWLDAANITLAGDPSRLQVIELRVFDHARRTLLGSGFGSNTGFVAVAPGAYQIRSMGAPLPDRVDVWFRASSHPKGEPIHRLSPSAGSKISLVEGTLRVVEIHAGRPGWSVQPISRPKIDWHPADAVRTNQCSVAFEWAGSRAGGRYQVAAVARDGRTWTSDLPHYLGARDGVEVLEFDLEPGEIDNFEVRPYGGRHTFYFEGVTLPPATPKSFGQPPSVTLKVGGRPGYHHLTAFDPVQVRVGVIQGDLITGIESGGFDIAVRPRPGSRIAFDATYEVEGLSSRGWDLHFLGSDGKRLRSYATRSGSVNTNHLGYRGIDVPLEQVDAIRFESQR